MKAKQLEYIKTQASRYRNSLEEAGRKHEPVLEHFIVAQLVNGHPIKLRPLAAVVTAARARIVQSASYRDLKFTQIFATPREYMVARAAYEEQARVLREKVERYNEAARTILRRCELEDDYPPENAAEALLANARLAGFKG